MSIRTILKTLVAFSLILIISGVAIIVKNNKELLNPVEDTYLLDEEDTGEYISITKSDDNRKPIVPDDETIDKQLEEKKIPIIGNTNTDPNDNLRKQIENKYNISVKYGVETDNYTISDLEAISLVDPNDINKALNILNNNLANYPEDFFKEISNDGYTLTIYLIKKFNEDNVTGVTDSTTKNVTILLTSDYELTESIHHELYHYVENYMYSKGAKYTTWNNLNPSNFKYGTENSTLSYAITKSTDAYFVNNYAQMTEEEDRASTFEYMTSQTKYSCLDKGNKIWLKAKYICDQIQAVFNCVSPDITEYWERYVY